MKNRVFLNRNWAVITIITLILLASTTMGWLQFGTDDTGQKWGIFNVIRNSNDNVWANTSGSNIQLAIWDLNGTGGTVWLTHGTYTITSAIDLENDIVLKGAGMYNTRIVQTTDYTNVVQCDGSPSARKHNITIMDMTLEHDTTGTGYQTLWIERTDGFIAKHLFLENAEYDAILVEESTDGMILNCVANGSGDDGFNIYSNSGRVSIIGCIARNITNDGVHCSGNAIGTTVMNCILYENKRGIASLGGDNLVFSGNVIMNNSLDGIYLFDNVTDVAISSNYIENNTRYGIYCQGTAITGGCSNLTIADNIIKNHTSGIYLSAKNENITIVGNTISNTTSHGIESGAIGCIISSNTILKPDSYGIVAAAQNHTITDNYIHDSGDTSIRLTQSHGIINGNNIYNAGAEGIYIYGTSLVNCNGNMVYSSADDGISTVGSSDCMINDNLVIRCRYGIWVYGSNNTVSDNKIEDPVYEGINVDCNYSIITSNNVKSARRGIEIKQNRVHNVISNNMVVDCNPGIQEDVGTDYNLIVNNEVSDCTVSITKVGANTVILGNIGYYTTFPVANVTSGFQSGFAWFETSSNILYVYNGTAWVNTTLYP